MSDEEVGGRMTNNSIPKLENSETKRLKKR